MMIDGLSGTYNITRCSSAAHTGSIRSVSVKLAVSALAAFFAGYIFIPLGGMCLKGSTAGYVISACGPLCSIVLLFGAVMFYKKSFRKTMLELGFRRFPCKTLLWGLPLAIALTLLGGAVTLLWGYIGEKLNWDLGVPPTVEAAMSDKPAEVIALLVTALLAAPVFDEIFFRRMIYGTLLKALPQSSAAFSAALIFAATHLSPLQLPGLCLLGFIWQKYYIKSRTLWTTVILHFFNNAIAAGLLLLLRFTGNDFITH